MANADDPTTGALRPRARQHDGRLDPSRPGLTRSRDGRVLTGLCAGIGRFIGADPTLIRVLFVISTVLTLGVMALVYVGLSVLVPAEPR